MTRTPMVSILRRLAAERPESSALTVEERTLSFAELDDASERAAHHYIDRGVRPGDVVVVALPNSIEFIVATFATLKVGASIAPLSHRLPPSERDQLIELARPRLVVGTDPGAHPGVQCISGELRAGATADPLPTVVSRRWKLTTSGGTSGVPKLIITTTSADLDEAAKPDYLLPTDDVVLIPGPLHHSAPFTMSVLSILHGNHLVLDTRFDAARTLHLIDRWRPSFLLLVPTMMKRILRLPDELRAATDMSSLHTVFHLASPCPEWLKQAWIDWLGADKIFELYGASDSPGNTVISGPEWLTHRGSVGRPALGEFAIRGPDGSTLPPGEVGEIWMRPPRGMPSRAHVVGAAAPSSDGWTTVGDLGRLDTDGYLYISDRRTDMLVTGGENVYPAEVEGVLESHRGVLSAVVLGLPDEDLGQRVHAIVQVVPGVTEDELREHVAERLARYKNPRSYEWVDRPLRDDAGKVRKRDLLRGSAGAAPPRVGTAEPAPSVTLTLAPPIAHVELNRPDKLNALNIDSLDLIERHIAAIEADDGLRVVVISGRGRCFCAGADLNVVRSAIEATRFDDFLRRWHEVFTSIERCTKPTIAAVHGMALAGGFELMQVCDLAVIGDNTRLGDQHAKFGLFPGGGSTQRLPRLVGRRAATWMLLSGEAVTPADALAIGLVNDVVPEISVLDRARELAETLAERSTAASRAIKESLRRTRDVTLASGLDIERAIAVAHMGSSDAAHGLHAFATRTTPDFGHLRPPGD